MDDYDSLQGSIDELERMIEVRRQGFVLILHDFRPVWARACDIQARFDGGVRFPSIHTRQTAWERFIALRNEASRVFKEQQEHVRGRSKEHRDEILSAADTAEYRSIDDAVFFFDRTTVEQMKVKARLLKEAFGKLSEYKGEMLGEHKLDCHERLREVRESHDLWWARYKETWDQRHTERQEARESKRERIQTNLDRNRERLENASEKIEKIRENIEENRRKLDETTSEKWIGIYTEWIGEGEAKIESIEGWINTLHEWIREGEDQLDALGG